MALTQREKLLDCLGYAMAALEKAAADMEQRKEAQQRVRTKMADVRDLLIEQELVKSAAAEQLEAALLDHEQALELIGKLTQRVKQAQVQRLGEPTGPARQERPAFRPMGSRFDGVDEATVRLYQGLGLEAPTS